MDLIVWYLRSPWYILGLLFVLYVILERNLSIKQKVFWILAILILGLLVIPIYFCKNNLKEIITKVTGTNNILKWALFIFFFAPSPSPLCIDSCELPHLTLPPVISWLPIFTILQFFALHIWLWHVIFCIPFAFVFVLGNNYIEKQQQWSRGIKRLYKIALYVFYWILISILWFLVPLKTVEIWLGI